jgi:phage/plasmid primase-like uncharacterized protein/late competence protein required for DNA uptake (superfamily II DNA/RNA helicase)
MMKTTERDGHPASGNKEQYNYKANSALVVAHTHNRWSEILTYFGFDKSVLSGKHSPCPIHGGKDGFLFKDDNGKGDWVCATCTNGHFEDGFNLIARRDHNGNNTEAFKRVAQYLNLSSNTSQYRNNEDELRRKTEEYRKRQLKEEQRKTEEKELSKKRAGDHAGNIISNCVLKHHPYLQNKGIDKPVLVNIKNYKVSDTQTVYAGALILPIYDINNQEILIGAQFINPDGQRFYISGTAIADGIHVIEGDPSLSYVGVVEGYATGLSVYMATGATVVIAFDANGMEGKAERLKGSFLGKQLVFFGDNDSHKDYTGNKAAHTAAQKTNGIAAIPVLSGKDWDDYRQKNGTEPTRKEINRQLSEYGKSIDINDKIIGLSIASSISLVSKKKSLSFDDALINHPSTYCICPISGGKAIINSGSIYSFELRKQIIPVLTNLYDQNVIDECKEIKSSKGRFKWITINGTQKHLYAFINLTSHRIGADLPNHDLFNEFLYKKTGLQASDEILNLVRCLQEARVNQAKSLIELDPIEFNKHIKLKQERQDDGSLKLNWNPVIEEAKNNQYKLIAIKAQHGQGKTQSFIKTMLEHANTTDGGMVVAHRRKLIAQISKELNCFNYEEYDKRYFSGMSLPMLKGMAICLHSFKHDHFLSYLKEANSIFIDEASQVLKTFYTDKNIHNSVLDNFTESSKAAQCIYLTDADLTTQDIKHYQQIFDISDKDVLVVTAEKPERDYTVEISCSSAPRHYRTKVIKSIEADLQSNKPCILAVESEAQGKSIVKFFQERFPLKNIALITSKTPDDELSPFIDNITEKSSAIDLLIHTSIIGTGVSVQHKDKRFTKGYGLFSGNVLSATECLQMMRRFRDITEWEIGLLCRPESMMMTSFYNDLGAKALEKHGIETSNIESNIRLNKERNKSLFIHALTRLLRDEYSFKIIGQLASDDAIKGMITTEEVREEEKQKLIDATPLPIEKALLARKRGYKTHDERYSSESSICRDYFKCKEVTEEEAEIWCNPLALEASQRQERVIKIIRLDPSIHHFQKQNEILSKAGISLTLFKKQRLTQEAIKELRNKIASQCAELVGLGFLRERYSKESKIPTERPIAFISEFLKFIGFKVNKKRSRKNDREYQLEIEIPSPMVNRLSIDNKTDKEILKEKAHKLKNDGLGYGRIAKELGLKNKFQARRLLET